MCDLTPIRSGLLAKRRLNKWVCVHCLQSSSDTTAHICDSWLFSWSTCSGWSWGQCQDIQPVCCSLELESWGHHPALEGHRDQASSCTDNARWCENVWAVSKKKKGEWLKFYVSAHLAGSVQRSQRRFRGHLVHRSDLQDSDFVISCFHLWLRRHKVWAKLFGAHRLRPVWDTFILIKERKKE